MIRRFSLVIAFLAALSVLPAPAEAVDLTGCFYSRTEKETATYETGTLRIGPVTRGVSETVFVNCTVRYGDPAGPIMGTVGGSLEVMLSGNGARGDGPVGLVVTDIYINYAPLGVPPVGTFLYGCMTSSDDKGAEVDHGCNLMHIYT